MFRSNFNALTQELKLNINDNGKGIVEEDMGKTSSFGLVGMRERIKAMNGEFQVLSTPGEGTTLEIRLPLTD
jgi:signal transduction histidine kinase